MKVNYPNLNNAKIFILDARQLFWIDFSGQWDCVYGIQLHGMMNMIGTCTCRWSIDRVFMRFLTELLHATVSVQIISMNCCAIFL